MKDEKKLTIVQIVYIIVVMFMLVIIGVITLTNNNEISLKEGRKLTTFPKITIDKLASSRVYNELTNAYADQLAFREDFVKLYYLFNLQRYVGDVVKGDNNQLFLSPLIIEDMENYEKKLEKTVKINVNEVVKEVEENGAKFIFLSVPRKDVVMNKYLPSAYKDGTEIYKKSVHIVKQNILQSVIFLDAYEIFESRQDECYDVYFMTDHHINVRGGYFLFEELVNLINKDGYNITIGSLENEYNIQKSVINGSYNRKIGQSVESPLEELMLIPKNTSVTFERRENGEKSADKVFGEGNTYAEAFMEGDKAETVIRTNNENAPNIMFVGSSYTNILEALSVYKFKTIVGIDYRDNKTGKSIAEYVKEYDIDYVVYICAQQNNSFGISNIKEHLGKK